MAEHQSAAITGGEEAEPEAQVLDIDPAQLAALLAQSADGTAQVIDEQGNTITLTAEQLAEAGIDLQNLEGAQVVQLAEGQQYVQGEDGQIYIIEGDDAAVAAALAGGYVDASALASGQVETAEGGQNVPKSQLEHRYPQPPEQQTLVPRSSGGFSATSPTSKQLQIQGPIMAAPKPVPTAVQQQHSTTTASRSSRLMPATGDHSQQMGGMRRDQLQGPSKSRRSAASDQYQQHANNAASVNNIPVDRFIPASMSGSSPRWQSQGSAAGSRQYGGTSRLPAQEAEADAELMFIQNEEMQLVQGGQQPQLGGNRVRSQPPPTSQMLRRGNFQSGLLPFQCDQCPRRFAHDHHLKRHQEMAHAKKRPFFCRYCNRDLYLASDLHFQGHLRMQHKQELDYEASYGAAGQSRSSGGQQQLQLRTANSTSAGGGGLSQAGTTGIDEEDEAEPDWDTLDAEKPREAQATEGQQNGGNDQDGAAASAKLAATTTEKENSTTETNDLEEQPGGGEPAPDADVDNHEQNEQRMEVDEPSRQTDAGKQKSTTPAKSSSSTSYVCDVCEKQFGKQEYLDKHKIAHTDQQPFLCQYCPRRFKWKENLIKHINWHMERMPFKCTLCPKGFPTQTRLDVHVKAKHMPKQREHVCPICSKGFYEKEYLAKHMRIHGSKIFPCTECDKKFIDEKFLRRHMMSHTQSRDFACDVCGKTFVKAAHLKSHRTIHTGERPYKCSKCQLTFGFKHNLRAHEKSEHGPTAGERTHICEHCGRAFAQKNNLDIHLRIHRGIKPFQCTSCLKQFSRLEHLRAHVNAHAGIRDHQCTVCEKYFFSKSNLRQHSLVHKEENERAFHCGSCPKKFKQRQHLSKHVKTHTKNTDVQYVVIWEKGGSLLEATIITDGVAQDATGEHGAAVGGTESTKTSTGQEKTSGGGGMDVDGNPVSTGNINVHRQITSVSSNALSSFPHHHQQATTLQMTDAEAAKLLAAATSTGSQVLDLSHVQLVDEEGNPIQGLGSDQLLILQDGTLATASADGTATAIAASSAETGSTVLDASALLALASEAQDDGTIYISEENLQALAQQGVVFSYEEAAQ